MNRALVSGSVGLTGHALFTKGILLVEVVETLGVVPAVIAARDQDVDFLVEILADIACVAGSCLGVEGEAPGVTQAGSPGLGPDGASLQGSTSVGGSLKEGVVGRDGVEGYPLGVGDDRGMGVGGGVAWLLVHIDTEDRGVKVLVDKASSVERVATAAAIAAADVEVTIRAEVEVATVVIARWVELGNEGLFGLGVDREGLHARKQEPGDTLVELSFNPKTIIDKDLLVFSILRVNGETEEAALAGGIKLPVLRAQLEDLALDGIGGGEPADHLNLPAEEIATLLLLISGVSRSRVALLDDEDGVLTAGQRGDRDREAELHLREGRLQGDDGVIGEGGGYAEKGGQGEGGGRTESHGVGELRTPKLKGGRMQKIFCERQGV